MPHQNVVRNIDGVTHILPKKSKRHRVKSIWLKKVGPKWILIVLIVVIISALSGWLLLHKKTSSNATTVIISNIAEHVVLPKNEQPLIATVTDKSSLKTPFLKEANNGDKIIIYEKAKRVIIYRPSIDRIIDIGPVELSNTPKTN